jgi:hypothetical protein
MCQKQTGKRISATSLIEQTHVTILQWYSSWISKLLTDFSGLENKADLAPRGLSPSLSEPLPVIANNLCNGIWLQGAIGEKYLQLNS